MISTTSIDVYSLLFGVCIGAVGTCIVLIGVIIRDIVESERRAKKEARIAHDKGYADGRKWRGYEKAWVECQIDGMREAITEVKMLQEQTEHESKEQSAD